MVDKNSIIRSVASGVRYGIIQTTQVKDKKLFFQSSLRYLLRTTLVKNEIDFPDETVVGYRVNKREKKIKNLELFKKVF